MSNGFNGPDRNVTRAIEAKLMEFEGETKMRLTENTELQIKEVSEFKKIKNGTDDERAKTISLKKSVVDKCKFFF